MNSWSHAPVEELSSAELRERARAYRLLAATAITGRMRDALLAMARRLEERAAKKEPERVAD
jgi:hypothetical protein